jgi:hypothetical protein
MSSLNAKKNWLSKSIGTLQFFENTIETFDTFCFASYQRDKRVSSSPIGTDIGFTNIDIGVYFIHSHAQLVKGFISNFGGKVQLFKRSITKGLQQ